MNKNPATTATTAFGAAIADFYEKNMVPMIFAPFADDLTNRLLAGSITGELLEIAAGTGIVTRKIAQHLPVNAALIATDVSPAMVAVGEVLSTAKNITWLVADALELPFPDNSFDLVFCQFGVMFFTDRVKAYQEIFRVLKGGGKFIFNTWAKVEENDFAFAIHQAVAGLFPDNPPDFLPRVPHSYSREDQIANDITTAGFTEVPVFEKVVAESHAESAAFTAEALVKGTPLRKDIEERDPAMLDAAVLAAEKALSLKFGNGAITGKLNAWLVSVKK